MGRKIHRPEATSPPAPSPPAPSRDQEGRASDAGALGEALAAREAAYRSLVENLPDMVARFDASLRYVYVNPALERMAAGEARAFLGRTNEELGMAEPMLGRWTATIEGVFRSGEPAALEFSLPRSDGADRVLHTRLIPERGANDAVVSVLSITRDVTAERRADEQLRRSEERYRLVGRATNDVIYDWNVDSGELFWSESLQRAFGYEPEACGNTEFWKASLHPDDVEDALAALQRVLDGVDDVLEVEYRFRRADGGWAHVLDRGYAIRDGQGRPLRLLGSLMDLTQRIEAERALRHSEQRFRSLVEASASIVWIVPSSGEVEEPVPDWEAFTGQPFEAYRGLGWLDAVHPDDRGPTADGWKHAVAARRSYALEHRVRARTGEYRVMEASGVPVLRENGSVREWVGVHTDVTDRRRSEQALRDSEARFRAIFDQAAVGIVVVGLDGAILAANPALLQMVGYTEGELVGRGFHQLLHPDDLRTAEAHFRERSVGGDVPREARWRLVDAQRETVWVDASATLFSTGAGGSGAMVAVVKDVTDQKRAEDALQASEELRRFAMGAAGVGVWEWDPDTDRIRWSDEVPRLHGLEPGWTPERYEDWKRMVHQEDVPHVEAAVSAALAQAGPYAVDFRVVAPDGSLRWLATRGRVLRGSDGRSRLTGVLLDITRRRLAESQRAELLRGEQELRRAAEASSRAKSEFLSMISHELRTPLATALTFAEVLESGTGGPLTDAQATHLKRLQASIWHVTDLVSEILDYTRLERGQLPVHPEPVRLDELVRGAVQEVEPLSAAKELPLRMTTAGDPLEVVTDPTRVRQVLLNLLSNAIKFTERGEISVHLDWTPDGAEIEVVDTGIGIAPQHLDRIFEPFWQAEHPLTRRNEGAGLGLTISRSIAELLGGSLDVRTAFGRGSRFRFRLPANAGSTPTSGAGAGRE